MPAPRLPVSSFSACTDPPPLQGLAVWEVMGRMAEMTGERDRDQLQHRAMAVLVALLQALSGRLVRPGDWRELDLETISPTETAYLQAVRTEHPVQIASQPARVVLPLVTNRGVEALVELTVDAPLDLAQCDLADMVLRMHRDLVNLLDDSERDGMTGLLNRKTFDETFMSLTSPLNRAGGPSGVGGEDGRRHWENTDPCWLAVVDIDHFKQVNDHFGHLLGDEVLLLLSRLMSESFRQEDRLYRFGGEEFVVLLRSANETLAREAFERLRARVASFSFPQVGDITVSIGFTMVDGDDTPEQAFGRADKALYVAKERGRNQVREYDELLQAGCLDEDLGPGSVVFF